MNNKRFNKNPIEMHLKKEKSKLLTLCEYYHNCHVSQVENRDCINYDNCQIRRFYKRYGTDYIQHSSGVNVNIVYEINSKFSNK